MTAAAASTPPGLPAAYPVPGNVLDQPEKSLFFPKFFTVVASCSLGV